MDDVARTDLSGRLRLVDSLVVAVTESLTTLQRLLTEVQHEVAQARREEEHSARDGEVQALRREVEQLRTAISSRAVIERAKGMLMQTHALSEEQSFALLAELANQHHRKLRDVAADLANGAGSVPAAPPRPHLVTTPDPQAARTTAPCPSTRSPRSASGR